MGVVEHFNRLFSGLDLVFFLMAFAGGVLFLVRVALALFGLGHHDLGGGGTDFNPDAGMVDSDTSFKFLNLQGLTVFFLMFGLVGLALHRGSGMGEFVSIAGATLAGLAMMALIAQIAQMMYRLQSSGNIDLSHAVGHTGTVYLSIPADGSGQVQVTVDGRLRTLDAVAEDKQAIPTGTRVQVAGVIDGRILIVKRA